MEESRIRVANWFDYPRCYDIAFQAYTQREVDFIEAACRKYCPFNARRFLEPACGTGRLITGLAARGYQVTGFDISQPALSYLRRRLARCRLHAEVFEAQMSDFRLGRPVDAAYCTISTFRHLLTEKAARGHLECIATSLRPGGIYVLGLHLLPLDVDQPDIQRWTQRRGKTKVTVILRVLRNHLHAQIEDLELCMLVDRGSRELRLRHEFQMRTYTLSQFQLLLGSVPALELCGVYDHRYDIERQSELNDQLAYSVLVLRRRLALASIP
jgi:SAM-dependent methyltransferase